MYTSAKIDGIMLITKPYFRIINEFSMKFQLNFIFYLKTLHPIFLNFRLKDIKKKNKFSSFVHVIKTGKCAFGNIKKKNNNTATTISASSKRKKKLKS